MESTHQHKITHETNSDRLTKPIPDTQFYNQLQNYTPICYSQGSPLFLKNKIQTNVIFMIMMLDAAACLEDIIIGIRLQQIQEFSGFIMTLFVINTLLIIVLNCSFILTLTMNPGIINLSAISEQQYDLKEKQYCIRCQQYRTMNLFHCQQCGVCIQNYDHHCKTLGRCIGSHQKYAFYIFLLSIVVMFLSFFVFIIHQIASM